MSSSGNHLGSSRPVLGSNESVFIAGIERALAALTRANSPEIEDRERAEMTDLADRGYDAEPSTLRGALALADFIIANDHDTIDAPPLAGLENLRNCLRRLVAEEAAREA